MHIDLPSSRGRTRARPPQLRQNYPLISSNYFPPRSNAKENVSCPSRTRHVLANQIRLTIRSERRQSSHAKTTDAASAKQPASALVLPAGAAYQPEQSAGA